MDPQGGRGGWLGATEESDWVEGLRDPPGRGLRDLVGFGGAKESAWVEGVNGSTRWGMRMGVGY
jgi:hypothetical protein